MFTDSHPWMKPVQAMAASVNAMRRPVAADNPFLAAQTQVSEHITASLDAYRVARDQLEEQIFFGFYGSSLVQALLGISESSEVRPPPDISAEQAAARRDRVVAYEAKLQTGGFDEALTRAVLYVTAAERSIDERCALALNVARRKLMHLSLAEFKTLVRDQFFVLQLEHERAVEVIATMVPAARERKELMKQVHAIVDAGDAPCLAESERLARLARLLAVPVQKLLSPDESGEAPVGTQA